ncbi:MULTISPECIES: SDR family NAD(P)-dependent oxidoreductase [unclassified Sphingomonas]|uniref:SDR family NAD(P)-dependent oxidoreductase n=1 Tax=unclassified Sphingomonas TaxID=196159 RepID=UPI0006FFAA41|nr:MULTISPECIES: SDR family NAD(P)-dependent oxidoreductase [unclassified Sphingomonas]KQX25643.1 short-chain dehydrogenase [Sphingomonas sp. Root1294]KQY66634.1 short-chain dehydrogenase [Sphingomonas sp. Root50]KRB90042.1 short-chain dehydrogenase [Sphingomonas sp. Root720]
MSKRFSGKVVVVTGASSGIGLCTAGMFAGEGAITALVDLNLPDAEKAVAAIVSGGGEAIAFRCDISDEAEVQQVAQDIVSRFGRIDVLVNNAGISITAVAERYDRFAQSVAVNLSGAFYWSRAAGLASMIDNRSGTIVNIASIAGLAAIPSDIGYVSAKHGIVGLTKALAVEWAKYGIRVNCVAPGITKSDMAQAAIDAEPVFMAERIGRVPLGRMGDAEDQARAILFLASDEAGYISGVTLPVDGGQMALHSGMPQKR